MPQNTVIVIRNAAASDFGGGERVPVFIAREIGRLTNVKVVILSSSRKLREFAHSNNVPSIKSPWLPYQKWSGIRMILVPIYLIWQLFLIFYYFVIFFKFKPSLVHPQSRDDFIAATIAARILKISVIWSDYADLKHNLKNIRIWYKNIIGKIIYICSLLTEKIFIVSEEDRRLIIDEVKDLAITKKFEVVYNGAFDTDLKAKKQKVFTFVSSGRVVTDKGIGELISAYERFHLEYPKSQLLIIGDGPDLEQFKNRANPIPTIIFVGYQKDPLQLVKSSHVFVLPTYHEGFSVALVEACMLGMPIIATNVGGNPEIITDRETGLLVKAKDSDDLFKKMIEIYEDSSLRENLSKNARKKYASNFNFKTIIKEVFIPLYKADK